MILEVDFKGELRFENEVKFFFACHQTFSYMNLKNLYINISQTEYIFGFICKNFWDFLSDPASARRIR